LAKAHLKRGYDVAGGVIQFPALRHLISPSRQTLLKPAYGGDAPCQPLLHLGDLLRLRPDGNASGDQLLPGKERAGIDLALRRYIAVADYRFWAKPMALLNIA